MFKIRGLLYFLGRLLGDLNALQKKRVNKRIGRRTVGRGMSGLLRKLFK